MWGQAFARPHDPPTAPDTWTAEDEPALTARDLKHRQIGQQTFLHRQRVVVRHLDIPIGMDFEPRFEQRVVVVDRRVGEKRAVMLFFNRGFVDVACP